MHLSFYMILITETPIKEDNTKRRIISSCESCKATQKQRKNKNEHNRWTSALLQR